MFVLIARGGKQNGFPIPLGRWVSKPVTTPTYIQLINHGITVILLAQYSLLVFYL